MNENKNSLDQRITAARESFGISVDALARVISVSPAYIRALESGDYGVFGAKVYARGVLKKILGVVARGDEQSIMDALDDAWEPKAARTGRDASKRVKTNGSKIWYLTPRRIGIILVVLPLAFFAAFAGARIIRFSAPPTLVIDEPRDQTSLREPLVVAKGKTERESKLTVNGRELIIDDNGSFKEQIELQRGVTALVFHSENRFGKSASVTRYVMVE